MNDTPFLVSHSIGPVDGHFASSYAQQQEAQKDFRADYSSEGIGVQPGDGADETVEVTSI